MLAYWKRADDPGAAPPDVLAIALFFVVACGWSAAAARWGMASLPGKTAPLIDGSVLVGFGPVMGALVADLIRPMKRAGTAGFLGRAPRCALAALAVPPLCLAAIGITAFHRDPHLDGVTIGLSMIAYCIGEELGWREWLHNMLGSQPLWRVALITWPLWFAWHWTFLWPSLLLPGAAPAFAGLLLVGSFALAAATRRTRGSAIAAAWHAAAKALGSPALLAMLPLLAILTWLAGAAKLPALRRRAAEPGL